MKAQDMAPVACDAIVASALELGISLVWFFDAFDIGLRV